jgi:hypothetical protein
MFFVTVTRIVCFFLADVFLEIVLILRVLTTRRVLQIYMNWPEVDTYNCRLNNWPDFAESLKG